MVYLFILFALFCVPSLSVANSDKGGVSGEAPKKVKLTNVKLVVEDPSEEYVKENLVAVSPVALRQKPSAVPIVHMNSVSVRIPAQPLLGDGSTNTPKVSSELPDQVQSRDKDLELKSKTVDAESLPLGPEDKPMLIESRGDAVDGLPRLPVVETYSPFHPPPPGTVPSTLLSPEPVQKGGSLASFGNAADDSLTLPPVASLQSSFTQPLPRIARATLANSSDMGVESSQGSGASSGLGIGATHSVPTLPSQGNGQAVSGPEAAFLTDSESQALLDIAGASGQQIGPANTVVGQTW